MINRPDPHDVPRITLPGVDRESASFVETLLGAEAAQRQHVREQQRGMAQAMVALGKPIYRGGAKSKRKKARR